MGFFGWFRSWSAPRSPPAAARPAKTRATKPSQSAELAGGSLEARVIGLERYAHAVNRHLHERDEQHAAAVQRIAAVETRYAALAAAIEEVQRRPRPRLREIIEALRLSVEALEPASPSPPQDEGT